MVERLPVDSVTVEQMADTSNAVELIVGVRRDPRFGPVAVVGIGGLLTEVIEDVVTALAPVDAASAKQMLRTLRAASVLDGVRGKSAVDIESAAEQIAAITRFACRHPELAEVEVNPLLATPSGAIALDARSIADETPDLLPQEEN
jgi:succinyl-CoA synthetase beta subunit